MANSTDIIITTNDNLDTEIGAINQGFGLQLNSCINEYESGGTRVSSFIVYAHSDSSTYETKTIEELFISLCKIISGKEMSSVMISSDDHGDYFACATEDGFTQQFFL